VHARLSQVRVHDESGRSHVVADGLLGYVLPGAEMQWPLPAGIVLTERDELQATLGGSDEPTIIPHRP
jgi:fimbrial chaperone protein